MCRKIDFPEPRFFFSLQNTVLLRKHATKMAHYLETMFFTKKIQNFWMVEISPKKKQFWSKLFFRRVYIKRCSKKKVCPIIGSLATVPLCPLENPLFWGLTSKILVGFTIPENLRYWSSDILRKKISARSANYSTSIEPPTFEEGGARLGRNRSFFVKNGPKIGRFSDFFFHRKIGRFFFCKKKFE